MNWDFDRLKDRCLCPITDYYREGDVVETRDGPYIFRDNGASVLGIAHLDTVLENRHFHHKQNNGSSKIYNAQLDDRLGAHLLLDVLPKLGLKFDVLLTDGEESARSTGAYFDAMGKYNWMFQFDRMGTDVVMYRYETEEYVDLLNSFGWKVGFGSFSDISMMEHLGCVGFNFGTAYYGQHTPSCFCKVGQVEKQVKKFALFFRELQGYPLPHIIGDGDLEWWEYDDVNENEYRSVDWKEDWEDVLWEGYNDEKGFRWKQGGFTPLH
jgi:hypothetical protein